MKNIYYLLYHIINNNKNIEFIYGYLIFRYDILDNYINK